MEEVEIITLRNKLRVCEISNKIAEIIIDKDTTEIQRKIIDNILSELRRLEN